MFYLKSDEFLHCMFLAEVDLIFATTLNEPVQVSII